MNFQLPCKFIFKLSHQQKLSTITGLDYRTGLLEIHTCGLKIKGPGVKAMTTGCMIIRY